MLNPLQQLNPKTFSPDCEQVPVRQGFGEGLVIAGEKNTNVVALCADLTESTKMNLFKERFPERFIEVGVAEQNLVTVASGMAHMGKIPYVSSYAMFSPGRNWEQIRTTIAYNDVPVRIVGSHAGISVGPDGGTHQAVEDIAIMRVIPNMMVFSPCDSIEAKKITVLLSGINTPAYIRLTREKTPVMTTEVTPFELGKGYIVWQPEGVSQVGIVATGALLHKALLAAKALESEGIKVKVLKITTIKPLDTEVILLLAKETGALVTVEEHQIIGGLGSAVSEVTSQLYPVPIEFIGVRDLFGQSGTPEELIEHYGMGENAIKDMVKKALTRKNRT
jgi:transketolase